MLSILPDDVTRLQTSGSSDMGTVGDDNVPGIFRHPLNVPWVLVWVRLHFEVLAGSPTGVANVILNRDQRTVHSAWNTRAWLMEARGFNADANFMVMPEEYVHWMFDADEALVLTWTNPDSGNLGWGAEVGMAPQSAVRA